jgi:hypothetical protein
MRKEEPAAAAQLLSIVVPLHDEEDNVLPLTTQVQAAMAASPWPWQLILARPPPCRPGSTPRAAA